jgi:predicted RNA binding protein YcfA (HicA-like mRNA interferase family)
MSSIIGAGWPIDAPRADGAQTFALLQPLTAHLRHQLRVLERQVKRPVGCTYSLAGSGVSASDTAKLCWSAVPRAPRITGAELVRVLCRLGFEVVSQRGSHVRLRRPGSAQSLIVPVHAGKIIGAGLLAAILDQAGIRSEDLRDA